MVTTAALLSKRGVPAKLIPTHPSMFVDVDALITHRTQQEQHVNIAIYALMHQAAMRAIDIYVWADRIHGFYRPKDPMPFTQLSELVFKFIDPDSYIGQRIILVPKNFVLLSKNDLIIDKTQDSALFKFDNYSHPNEWHLNKDGKVFWAHRSATHEWIDNMKNKTDHKIKGING